MTKLETSKSETRVEFGRTEVSVRLDCLVFVALFHLGMVPGILVFKNLGKVWIFIIFVMIK